MAALTIAIFVLSSVAFLAPANATGAVQYGWHLSGAVMPVPPYGSMDIIGSDTASKLIVNQPNGNVKVTITGVMNGLTPDTTYTVYLSKGYTPYKLSITGAWDLRFIATSGSIGTYDHHMDVTQASDGTLTGTGYYIPASSYTWVIDSGSYVSGNNVVIKLHFTNGHPTCWASTFTGTIDGSGKITGTWVDTGNLCGDISSSGTLTTLTGQATHTGDAGWPGLFTSTIQPFTFTTDGAGSGSWHVNVTKTQLGSGGSMSVWINNEAGLTMLISDSFAV